MKSLSNILKLLFLTLSKTRLFNKLTQEPNISDLTKLLLLFSLQKPANRLLTAWIHVYATRLERNQRIAFSLFIGFVAAIDEKIDNKAFILEDNKTAFRDRIYSSSLGNNTDFKIRNFYNELVGYLDSNEKNIINNFLENMIEVEYNFRIKYSNLLKKNHALDFDVVKKYREQTTIAYAQTIFKLVNRDLKFIEKSIKGTWFVQYLDDYADALIDYQQLQPNLFLSTLMENNELDEYITTLKAKSTLKEYLNNLFKMREYFHLPTKIFMTGWIWFINYRNLVTRYKRKFFI